MGMAHYLSVRKGHQGVHQVYPRPRGQTLGSQLPVQRLLIHYPQILHDHDPSKLQQSPSLRMSLSCFLPDVEDIVCSVERPQIIKRINRDAPVTRENEDMSTLAAIDPTEKPTSRLQTLDVADSGARQSPRAANGQPLGVPKEAPLGPRNPASRGHRLAEDPSSRPPPSASMPPPRGPSNTASAQELRASATQHSERPRSSLLEKDTVDGKAGAEARRPDITRSGDSSRTEPRRRSQSPSRPIGDTNADARRREDDRRSSRDEHRRTERRPGREDERDRERDKDRRSEREREREGRRDRDASARGTGPRSEDPNRTPGSPHRQEDASGRKRLRDPREDDVSVFYSC
jgi:THO complex subunit 2